MMMIAGCWCWPAGPRPWRGPGRGWPGWRSCCLLCLLLCVPQVAGQDWATYLDRASIEIIGASSSFHLWTHSHSLEHSVLAWVTAAANNGDLVELNSALVWEACSMRSSGCSNMQCCACRSVTRVIVTWSGRATIKYLLSPTSATD